MHPQDNINLHSEELNEALGTPPSWLARFGVQSAYLAIFVLVALCYLVKYPDVVLADKIKIVGPTPTVEVFAQKAGLLQQVLVAPDEVVEANRLIVIFSSTAILADVDSLERSLGFFSDRIFSEDIKRYQPPQGLQLGSIQETYAELLKDYNALKFGAMSDNQKNTISRKNVEINEFRKSIDLEKKSLIGLTNRREIIQTAVKRLKSEYLKDTEENAQKLDQYSSDLAEIRNDSISISTRINNYERNINEIRNEIAEYKQQTGSDEQYLTFQIGQSIDKLKSRIRNWKEEHLLFAPIAGRVTFFKNFGVENQTVREGERIFKVYPEDDIDEIYAKVDLPSKNSGSVEPGQEVVIKINNYPHRRYGLVKGVVRKKADVLQEDGETYLVEVDLPEGLLTSFGQELDFTRGMQGTAEIITKEKRLIYRLFDNVFAELHL